MIRLARKILALLDRAETARFRRLLMAVVLTSFIEVIGISSVMPFIAVVADPGLVQQNRFLSLAMSSMGVTDIKQFTILLGAGAFGLLILSNTALALINWRLMDFTYGLGHTISSRLLRRYLFRSYEAFLAANTADAKKNVLDETVQIVNSATVPFMQAIARIPVVLLIAIMILAVDPVLAPLVIALFGGLYLFIYYGIRKWLARIGAARVKANEERFRAAHESIDALVEIKLLAKEAQYQRRYDESSRRFAQTQAMSMTLAMTPRYVFETLAFGGIILIVVYMLIRQETLGDTLPVITFYAMAGYRLMPALQLIFTGLTKARFGEPALDMLAAEHGAGAPAAGSPEASESRERWPLRDRIAFRAVGFRFAGQENDILRNVSFEIRAGTVVGVAGPTGSGKTTIAHLLMGLLHPTDGEITIDGTRLDATNVRHWQSGIGYVSQQIYLADASVSANIALGEPADLVDAQRVESAARLANIHEFISSQLPKGYATLIGDRGARLSGGQRQRLAIARALYHDPDVLVFDEATSALDTATEEALMEAINTLASQKTIIVIAHRLNTLRIADNIIVVERGNVVAQGTLDELACKGVLPTLQPTAAA